VTQFWTSPVVQRVLWGLAIFAAALIISYLVPPLVALLREARHALAAFRERILAWASRVTDGRWSAFWHSRQAEPLEPVLAGLGRIDATARTLGAEQVGVLQRLDTSLAEQMRLLRAAAAPNPVPAASDRSRITATIASSGVGKLIGLVFLAGALGLINATLLSVFFREFIGARSPIPTLLPELQIGHVLAALFFILEVASGYFIHQSASDQRVEGEAPRLQTRSSRVFQGGWWVLLGALVIVELVAYAVLSDRLNIPAQLSIPADSPFFGFTRFFFAAFGLALTCGLAGVGHELAESLERRRLAAAERRLLRALERRDDLVANNVDRVRKDVEAIRNAAHALPESVASRFQEDLGLQHRYPGAPIALYAATVQVVSSVEPSSATALTVPGVTAPGLPPLRSRSQVLGDLAVQLTFVTVLVLVSWLTFVEIVTWLGGRPGALRAALTWAAGLSIPAAAIGIGLAGRSALARLRYATPTEQALGEPRGRKVFGTAVVVLGIALALALALIAVRVQVLGFGLVLNALLGMLQAGVLMALGGFFEAGMVAVVHLAYLGWLGAMRTAAAIGVIAAHLIGAACALGEYALRVLAIPGDVIRSVFSKTSRPEVSLATPRS
jgi:hypothetical protein